MIDLYYNIIIIVLVLVLFLAYILIAYFYTSYSNYKEDVDDNFEKTKNYINTSISKIDDNIRSSITENNTKINNTSNYINDINTKVNRVDLKSEDNYYEVKNSLNNYSSNLNKTNLLIDSNNININKFDTNIKQFIQYKSNGTTINDAIYNYQFGVSPNLSLDFLRNVNAISGMTIETDNISNFRLCDKNKNCMDMNINNEGLNIFPTNFSSNTTNNIFIYDKKKEKILAKFDLANRGIYLGGEGENAGMYINDSNVYIKKINIINNSDNYSSVKTLYDKNNKGQIQSYNTYPFELDDINNNKTEINGIYYIIKGSETPPQNEIIFNIKCSNDIPSGTSLNFDIQELSNTSTTDIIITSIETIPTSIISSAVVNTNIIKLITSTIINKDRNYRIKIKSQDITINSIYTEPNITNIINYRL
jgi:hypothetical protein